MLRIVTAPIKPINRDPKSKIPSQVRSLLPHQPHPPLNPLFRPLLSLARIFSSCTVSSRQCRFLRPLNHCHCKLLSLLSHYHCPLPRRKAAAHSSHQAHHNRPSNVWPSPPSCQRVALRPPMWNPQIWGAQTPLLRPKMGVWVGQRLGLKAKMATSAPSPPSRLENWDLGQKRDFAPNP